MKITELALDIGISTNTIKNFIQDFDLELSSCLFPNMEVKDDFEKFARENLEFLQKYEADLADEKSCKQIAKEINQPVEKVEEIVKKNVPILYENGLYKSSVSKFGIDHELGGNYQFVYDYFGKKTALANRDFIGYRDLYFYITEMLDPFLDEKQALDWGINKPNGIMLYGPKGSGKIFWAKKIAEIIDYDFNEVKTSYIQNAKNNFGQYLTSIMMKQGNKTLFIENFNEISSIKNTENIASISKNDAEDVILHSIHKFTEENLLLVAATDSLSEVDAEVFSPGRFDILIPVFPPNLDERAQMILRYLTSNLVKESVLTQILEYNKADSKPFWLNYASRMKLFSNTMVIDFTQSVKKRLRSKYLKTKNPHFHIEREILELSYIESKSKLTDNYLQSIQYFINEVAAHDYDVFKNRIDQLKFELDSYRIAEPQRKTIGFEHGENGKA
ncbi:AAA family ATPase [Frigoriflavimonas asaccharolytica]|uniref:ATPase AAA-type core domain-containing protein n=1 Tax=Frigoriflavimonas asaccharolytica TaxID=2735899 RepID=A0A8J8G5E6_9FLAO|nr:ATP-binding protein [Frigoriflavimonas asaccharolytica]NRS91783.1 hypothetical protein [Frigoriflavimonas asaccharolytica]